ncbi:hypothetical protein NQ317_015681 [Molorchus minor]|uniref:NTR domain-containing protein n=1 Tax=Molorchus minor TaxID=1323400 RepID=A0ABQ9JMP4_9CUCU|nr:hypothetical protein NQ317_015681 [Molorchus minor]
MAALSKLKLLSSNLIINNENFHLILARVKRVRVYNDSKIYKVRVRREYKVSEKGILALKSGRLITHRDGAMCGSELQPGKLYALSGRIHSLKAYINLCNMAIEWEQLTRRQRKGLKRMYKLGCLCNVKTCMYQRCYRQKDDCNWTSECQYKR